MAPGRCGVSSSPYQYVVLRCVPRVERGEFMNVGVALHCQAAEFLGFDWHFDPKRLGALDTQLDPASVCDGLGFIQRVCAGDPSVGAAARQPPGTRFGFIKAPRSTVLQPGPVHSGLTEDPAAELHRLVARLVR